MSQARQGQYAGSQTSAAPRYTSSADVRSSQQRPQAYRQQSGETGGPSRQGSYSNPQQDPRIPAPPLLADVVADTLQRLPHPAEWPSRTLSYVVIDPMLAVLRILVDVVISPRTHRIVLRLGVLATLFWTAFALAIAAYVGFYRAWVPDIGLTRSVYLQYGYDMPPYAVIDLNIPGDKMMGLFAEDQAYDVSLDLVVPLSAANLDLGNFMIALELQSPLNNTIYRISKPSIIVHEPAPIRAMNNFVFQLTQQAPSLILPTSSPPVQLMTIQLLSRSVLQPAHPAHPFATPVSEGVSKAIVTVGRSDADRYWRYGGGHGVGGIMRDSGGIMKAATNVDGFRSRGELQTHSASLRFDAHLTGLRYFMYHYPLASFFIFTILFMSFEMMSALTLWAIAAFYTSTMTQPSLEIQDNYRGGARRYRGPGAGTITDDTETESYTARRSYGDDGHGSDTVTGAESETDDAQRDNMGSSARQAQSPAGRQPPSAPREGAREQQGADSTRDRSQDNLLSPMEQPRSGSPYDELGGLVDQPRRVLGRLDEETEEETDARSTATSAGWENIGDVLEDEGQPRRYSPDDPDEERTARLAGLRQRRSVKPDSDEDEDEQRRFVRGSTAGGSATSRSSTAPSFGASLRASTTPGASSAAGPSRLASAAPAEVKAEQSDDTTEPELETDDSDEKRPAREAGSEDDGGRRGRAGDTSASTSTDMGTSSSSGAAAGEQTPRNMQSEESSLSD